MMLLWQCVLKIKCENKVIFDKDNMEINPYSNKIKEIFCNSTSIDCGILNTEVFEDAR